MSAEYAFIRQDSSSLLDATDVVGDEASR